MSNTTESTIYYRGPVVRAEKPQRQGSFYLGLLFFTFATGLLVAGLSFWAVLMASPVMMPTTHVFDVTISGQTIAEATTSLETYWQQRTITLQGTDTVWVVTPEDLGITFDAQATAVNAHTQGRTWQSIGMIWQQGALQTAPVWSIDPTQAERYLQAIAPQLETPAQDATIRIVRGRAEVVPAHTGQAIDFSATLQALQTDGAMVLMNGRLPLVFTTTEPAVTNASAAMAHANELLSMAIQVEAYDPVSNETQHWTITPDVWGDWLTIGAINPAELDAFSWAINPQAVASGLAIDWGNGRFVQTQPAINAITQAIVTRNPHVSLRLYHPASTHTVQAGETLSSIGQAVGIPYPWLQQANPNVTALSVGQQIVIPSPDVMIPLPVVTNKRVVVSISQQKAWVYEDGALKWEWEASTGISTSPTAPGVFQIQTHEENAYAGNWDLWMPYFMGIYQPVPTSEFMNGFHGFPTRGGSQLLWTNNLGTQVTYGCVLLSTENAQLLFDWAEAGVIVEIQS